MLRRLIACQLGILLMAGCPGKDEPFNPWLLDELSPADGFTVVTPEFDVPAGAEVQDCYFFQVPDLASGADLWVKRTLTAINPGSHHMNVFRVRTIGALDPANGTAVQMGPLEGILVSDGECWNSAAWADWPLVTNSQKSDPNDPFTDWTLPEGVAARFTPGETIMLQVHYVNATTQETPFKGRVGINFYRDKGTAAPQELGTLFATQQSIRICPSNPRPKYAGTCALPNDEVTVIGANGHFHSRGSRFKVFGWDGVSDVEPPAGDMFYESDVWDDPPMAQDLTVPINAGGGVWWTCEYEWVQPDVGCDLLDERDPLQAGECCYTFGGYVETSEHCNVFLYYYPKIADTDIFCN